MNTQKINKKFKSQMTLSIEEIDNRFGCLNDEKINFFSVYENGIFGHALEYRTAKINEFNRAVDALIGTIEMMHTKCAYLNCNICPLKLMVKALQQMDKKS